jgi:hypothetical protein
MACAQHILSSSVLFDSAYIHVYTVETNMQDKAIKHFKNYSGFNTAARTVSNFISQGLSLK